MVRYAVRVLLAVGLVAIGWVAGHAQETVVQRNGSLAKSAPPELSGDSDFELQVFIAAGEAEVRCVRGCRLTWAPTVAPKGGAHLEGGVFVGGMLMPGVKVDGLVTDDGCVATGWNGSKNCHILGWKRDR